MTVYFLPAVAIGLGALLRDETIAAVSLVGTVLVTTGAYIVSRSELGPARPRPVVAPRPRGPASLRPATTRD